MVTEYQSVAGELLDRVQGGGVPDKEKVIIMSNECKKEYLQVRKPVVEAGRFHATNRSSFGGISLRK